MSEGDARSDLRAPATIDAGAGESVLSVRDARPDEAESIDRMVTDALQGEPPELRAHLGRVPPGAEVVTAELAGELSGTVALCGAPGDVAEIRALAVRPDVRRRGIGRRLVLECVGRAAGRGLSALIVRLAPGMGAARALFERAGFRRATGHDLDLRTVYDVDDVSVLDRRWDRPGAEIVALGYRLDLPP